MNSAIWHWLCYHFLTICPSFATKLNSLGAVVGVVGTVAVDPAHLTIQPAISAVLVTHGGLVEVPVVVVLRNTVVRVVNPTVKMSDPIIILSLSAKYQFQLSAFPITISLSVPVYLETAKTENLAV